MQILVGNLGGDPQIRYTPNGTAVANFNIATTERFTNKNGEKESRTEWHRIVAWGRLAEICNEYLKKGKQVYVEGRIQTRQWEDKEGGKRTSYEIIANTMVMLGRAGDAGDVAPQEFQADEEATQEAPAGRQEDDLPF